ELHPATLARTGAPHLPLDDDRLARVRTGARQHLAERLARRALDRGAVALRRWARVLGCCAGRRCWLSGRASRLVRRTAGEDGAREQEDPEARAAHVASIAEAGRTSGSGLFFVFRGFFFFGVG